ncbi:MAG: SDR family NAD(P)-dependent oxidoreductase [Pseudomonadota bacterium]
MNAGRAGEALPRRAGDDPSACGDAEAIPHGGDVLALDLAIVGRACRLPDAPDVARFWRLLRSGRSAIGTVPQDRWASGKFSHQAGAEQAETGATPAGHSYTQAAGILDDLWDFDAARFGIAPREASQMDPQQRIALELADTALAEAGLSRAGQREGLQMGVWVGASAMDHAQRFAGDIEAIDSPFMTGNTLSIIANRIAHAFDARGPSLTVDTACASGLTALHMAAAALDRGAVDVAVVVAVNALLQPWNFVGFSRARMLSPTGRCRPFAAGADGYVRAEGGVAFVLIRREEAEAAQRPVHGRIRGSGIGTDGWTPGLTRPSADAQAALIAAVHGKAAQSGGPVPSDLAFVEAHGTGTPTGDPIEVEALSRALGAARAAAGLGPLPVGSAKSNIGHLEPAAGLVGLLKATLALEERWLPPTLGAGRLMGALTEVAGIEVARRGQTVTGTTPTAAVSAFGFGGANAHVLIQASTASSRRTAPPHSTPTASRRETLPADDGDKAGTGAPRALPPLLLSARDTAGLAQLVDDWRRYLRVLPPDQLAPTLRAHGHRAARHATRAVLEVTGTATPKRPPNGGQGRAQDRAQGHTRDPALDPAPGRALGRALDALSAALAEQGDAPTEGRRSGRHWRWRLGGGTGPALSGGEPAGGPRKIAFVFAGNGGQWAGMGRTLIAEDSAARAAAEATDRAFVSAGIASPLALIMQADDAALEDSVAAQATVFLLQVAQVEALRAAGLAPDIVAGHSLGEVAAAWCSGRLTLAAAARLVVGRARAVAPLRGLGGMATLATDQATAHGLLERTRQAMAEAGELAPLLDIAAVNAPRATTVSGSEEALAALLRLARRARVAMLRLQVPYPYHGAALDQVADALRAAGMGLEGGDRRLPMVSGIDGQPLPEGPPDADYWWRNARHPVGFERAVQALHDAGARVHVEIGPRPLLARHIGAILAASNADKSATGSTILGLARGPGQPDVTPSSLALDALIAGAASDDRALFGAVEAARPGPVAAPARQSYRQGVTPGGSDLFGLDETGRRGVSGDGTADRAGGVTAATRSRGAHPRLGFRDRGQTGPWLARLDAGAGHWLGDHRLNGTPVMPAMGWAEIALAAARRLLPDGPVEVQELLPAGLVSLATARRLRTTATPDGARVTIEHSAEAQGTTPTGNATWRLAAQARLSRGAATPPWPTLGQSGGLRAGDRGAPQQPIDGTLYDHLTRAGLDYGAAFRRTGPVQDYTTAPQSEGGAHHRYGVDQDTPDDTDPDLLHPTVLDAALHGLARLIAAPQESSRDCGSHGLNQDACHDAWLPTRIGRLWLADPEVFTPRIGLTVEAILIRRGAESAIASLAISRQDGQILAVIDQLVLERLAQRMPESTAPSAEWISVLEPVTPAEGPDGSASDTVADTAVALLQREGAWRRDVAAVASDQGTAQNKLQPASVLLLDEIGHAAAQEEDGVTTGGATAQTAATEPLGETIPALIAVAPDTAADLIGALKHRDGLDTSGPAAAMPDLRDRATNALLDAFLGALQQSLNAKALTTLDCRAPIARAASPLPGDPTLTGPDPQPARHSPEGARADIIVAADAYALDDPRLAPGGLVIVASARPASSQIDGGGPTPLSSRRVGTDFGDVTLTLYRAAAQTPEVQALPNPITWRSGRGRRELSPLAAALEHALSARRAAAAPQGKHGASQSDATITRASLSAMPSPGETVVVAPPEAPPEAPLAGHDSDPADTTHAEKSVAARIALARRIAKTPMSERPRAIVFLSRGALGPAVPGEGWRAADAALPGLVRTLINELAPVEIRLVDLDPALDNAQSAAALAEIVTTPPRARILHVGPDGVRSLLITRRTTRGDAGGKRLIRRGGDAVWQTEAHDGASAAGPATSLATPPQPAPGTSPSTDRPSGPAILARAHDAAARSLTPGKVRIAVAATGANYRDALWRGGHLPAEAMEAGFCGATLGMECAGRIVASGPGCALPVGAAVVALAPAAMADLVETDARLAVPLPADGRAFWPGGALYQGADGKPLRQAEADPAATLRVFAAAAALPVAYLTAWHGLSRLACLGAGETVFVQGGAGGVGLAAIAVARHLGARVIAGAGTPARRRLVRALGAEATVDSRDPALADAVRHAAGSRVDVVLNAAAGAGLKGALDCLAPFGRLIELGKRDLYGDADMALRPFADSLSFHAFDADRWLGARPAEAGKSLAAIIDLIAKGALPMLPFTALGACGANAALALMRRSGHVGKIVIHPPLAAIAAQPKAPLGQPLAKSAPLTKGQEEQVLVQPGRPWLIVGSGAIGIAMAECLARSGTDHIILLSRRGPDRRHVEALAATGVQVQAMAADATAPGVIEEIAAAAKARGAPLAGAVHAAMVLEDAALAQQTAPRVARVLAAKLTVAQALDTALGPDGALVLMGSISAHIGTPGQVAYAAANGALERLASLRQAAGRPSIALVSGPVLDAGHLAARPERAARVARDLTRTTGGAATTLAALTARFSDWLAAPDRTAEDAITTVFGPGTGARRGTLPLFEDPAFDLVTLTDAPWSGKAPDGGTATDEDGRLDWRACAVMPVQARQRMLVAALGHCAAAVLGAAPDGIDADRPLAALGFDSLMAVELGLSIERRFGVSLETGTLAEGLSLNDLATRLTAAAERAGLLPTQCPRDDADRPSPRIDAGGSPVKETGPPPDTLAVEEDKAAGGAKRPRGLTAQNHPAATTGQRPKRPAGEPTLTPDRAGTNGSRMAEGLAARHVADLAPAVRRRLLRHIEEGAPRGD